jgi:hypothetical protein
MIDLTDIHPLTGFLRDHKAHLERLRATGRPEVLTVNGTARVVVQDAAAYQRLLDLVEALETEQIVRERLRSIQAGEPGVPAAEAIAAARAKIARG